MKIIVLCIAISSLTNCASSYKMIQPKSINYVSSNENSNVELQYRYELLHKKYFKKELKKGIKLVAIKITNNSNKDLIFGKDIVLTYENDSEIYLVENKQDYKLLKQSPLSYLWYLLLTPTNLFTTETNSSGIEETTSSTPIGLLLGPGLAVGNMVAADAANKKFKTELLDYNIKGTVITKGETQYGLIGIQTNSYDSIKLKVN